MFYYFEEGEMSDKDKEDKFNDWFDEFKWGSSK